MKLRLSPVLVALVLAVPLLGAGAFAGEDTAADRVSSRFRNRPPRFTVLLQLDEIGFKGQFTEVSGLGSESEVVEFRDGSDPNAVRKIPGRLHWPDITLKRGLVSDASLWQWRRLVETGNITDARTNGSIVLLDRGTPVAQWRFVNAWPAKITGPELNADGNEIAIEELVIAHEGMARE